MLFAPFIAIFIKEPQIVESLLNFKGTISQSADFDFYYFGFALGISLSLIGQIGEQVDYLRFMPPLSQKNRIRWWSALLIAGPGWIVLGLLKQLGGILLAFIVLLSGMSIYEAKTPIEMYTIAYTYIFSNAHTALFVATFFVILSQIKINVTNAYAGSLAWSNFFSRLTHSHPGRVVWMIFNISIALLLMELGLFDALEKILGLYSNLAIAWISAISADLVINKPLGLSPKVIEFKRAYLYKYNPVGLISMGVASTLSVIAFMGLLGELAQSYSSIIALVVSFILSPIVAYLTKGKYYIARENTIAKSDATHLTCRVCEKEYEKEDMSYCPLHEVTICSLCCSLDSSCHDRCKLSSEHSLKKSIAQFIETLLLGKISQQSSLRLFNFIMLSSLFMFILGVSGWLIYTHKFEQFITLQTEIESLLLTFFIILTIFVSTMVWIIILIKESKDISEAELEAQNRALEKQNEIYNLVYTGTKSAISLIDIATNTVIDCNDVTLELMHVKKEDILHKTPPNFAPEFQPNGMRSEDMSKEVTRLAIEKGSHTFEWYASIQDSDVGVWSEVTLTPIQYEGKDVLHVVSRVIDERKALEQKNTLQAQALQQIHDSVIITDLEGNITSWNLGSEKMLGYNEIEILTKNISTIHREEDKITNKKHMSYLLKHGAFSVESYLMRKDGSTFLAYISLSLLKDTMGNIIGFIGISQDITEKKEAEERLLKHQEILDYQAHYDALTGLPNRILFNDRLSQGIKKAKRNQQKLALLFLDLDRFKEINDSLGHLIGDKVLQAISKKLLLVIREQDTLSRLGGDEFTIILEDIRNNEDASILAQKILTQVSEPLYIEEHTLYVSCSIGISLYPTDSTDANALLKFSDAAMYKAKDEGKNTFQFYTTDMTNSAYEQITMQTNLRKALANEEFEVYFQPQVSAKTNTLIGMEALIRWHHPTLGFVSPDSFIPIAEDNGLIIDIDRWVMRSAMTSFAIWKKEGLEVGKLALNLSIKQLYHKDFLSVLAETMDELSFPDLGQKHYSNSQ